MSTPWYLTDTSRHNNSANHSNSSNTILDIQPKSIKQDYFLKMFGRSSKHEEKAPQEGRRQSVKDLEARALDVWTSPTYSNASNDASTKKPRKGSFEAVRAAKAAARGDAQGTGLVMRT
jgi:hypothetical protein